MTSSQYAGDLIEKEYFFGLSQFRDILEHAEANITTTQLEFLSDGINLLVFFGENLTFQASELFENYGFVVDARQVYVFVTNVRAQIKTSIDQLMRNVTEVQIKRDLQKSFESYSMQLKEIFDKEIGKIYDAANHNYENLDCWDGYKVPILELGYSVVNDLKTLTLSEAAELTKDFAKLNQEVSSTLTQIVADLSTKHSTLLTTRSRVATYVSAKLISVHPEKGQTVKHIVFCFRSKTTSGRLSIKLRPGSLRLALHFDGRQSICSSERKGTFEWLRLNWTN